jgi:hypothetical protein
MEKEQLPSGPKLAPVSDTVLPTAEIVPPAHVPFTVPVAVRPAESVSVKVMPLIGKLATLVILNCRATVPPAGTVGALKLLVKLRNPSAMAEAAKADDSSRTLRVTFGLN